MPVLHDLMYLKEVIRINSTVWPHLYHPYRSVVQGKQELPVCGRQSTLTTSVQPGRHSVVLSKAGLPYRNPGASIFQPPGLTSGVPQEMTRGKAQSRRSQDTPLAAPPVL